MNKLILLLLFITAVSCKKDENPVQIPETEVVDPDWLKLEIPLGREAFAIAGDIEKTLLVTTHTKAYYTTDQGKTWQESKNFNGPVPGLYIRNDTTFSLESAQTDSQGVPVTARTTQYFTADYGKTWDYYGKHYKNYLDVSQPIGETTTSTGVKYSIKRKTTPLHTGSSAYYENPSQLSKQRFNAEEIIKFPFRHKLMNLYLDANNRLYVAASGGKYIESTNSFHCCTPEMTALVYVSRKPLP